MDLIDVNVESRTRTGNGPARQLRGQARIPAVLYGRERSPLLLSVGKKDFENALKAGPSRQLLLRLNLKDGGLQPPQVMIKEIQTHPVSREFLHVDFYEIDLERKIHVSVPVVVIGTPVGVEKGGMLQIVRREVEVLCLPAQIPQSIEIDVSGLEMGDSIHVQDIAHKEGIEIPAEVNYTVVTVLSPKREEAAPTGEEAEEAEEAGGENA